MLLKVQKILILGFPEFDFDIFNWDHWQKNSKASNLDSYLYWFKRRML